MPAALAGHPVNVDTCGRKDPLPGPLAAAVGVLLAEGPRQFDPAGASLEIDLMLVADRVEGPHEIGLDGGRQHREAVCVPFPGTYHELVAPDIDVLHAQARAFEKAAPRAVQQERHQPGHAVDFAEDGTDLLASQDDGEVRRALRVDEVVPPGEDRERGGWGKRV